MMMMIMEVILLFIFVSCLGGYHSVWERKRKRGNGEKNSDDVIGRLVLFRKIFKGKTVAEAWQGETPGGKTQ